MRGKKAAIAAAIKREINDEDTNLEENELEPDINIGDDGLIFSPYIKSKLMSWKPAPPVTPKVQDLHGEKGMYLIIYNIQLINHHLKYIVIHLNYLYIGSENFEMNI